ncbi:ankyrin repeat-containing domain protein [Aspergillus pseudodeflectus]|uniref:Ankyrin repeat-containing domain protein n=1 Tax=Aspergillus pseudodeflectus TaxID=176178 RepID=A0ABR4K5L7_9EURO
MLFRPHDIPALALSDGDPHGRINEETLLFAARYSHPNMLSKLLKRSNQQITGAVLEAAARNVNGIATLTWLLGRLFDPAVITPGLVVGATQNARHGGDFISYLQSGYPCQTRAAVNEKVVLAAAFSRQISFLDMLEQRYSVTVTEEHRSIARLRHASLANDLRTVQDLLATSVHPDYPDGAGRTPLRLANKRGFLKIVRALIGTGRVDVNAQDDLGQTPLLVAVLHEHHDLIYPLMEAGADHNLKDSCRDTPYLVAEKAGDYISLRRFREAAKLRAVRETEK